MLKLCYFLDEGMKQRWNDIVGRVEERLAPDDRKYSFGAFLYDDKLVAVSLGSVRHWWKEEQIRIKKISFIQQRHFVTCVSIQKRICMRRQFYWLNMELMRFTVAHHGRRKGQDGD